MAVAAIAVAVLLGFILFRGVAVEAAYPAERLFDSFARGVWSRVSGALKGSAAAAENIRLRREVASLAVVRSDLEALERENARLRKSLGFAERSRGRWIPAPVLSRGGAAAGAGRTLRIGAGSLGGVREGAAAVSPDGLVGLVTAVTPHTAEVRLVWDARVKVSCEVETREAAKPRGILCGGGEDVLALRHLSNRENASPRARVVTTGAGGVFPAGILAGYLVDAGRGAADSEGAVQPAVDFNELEDVFVRSEE